MGKNRKFKAKPNYIDRNIVLQNFKWDFYNTEENIGEIDDETSYIIIPKSLYDDKDIMELMKKMFGSNNLYFSIKIPDETMRFHAIIFENTRDKYVKHELLSILNNYIMKNHYTLRDFIDGNMRDYKTTYKNIIIYNNKNELISNVKCSKKDEEVYDVRNNHGVEIAKTEDNFLYNFLTKTLKSLTLKSFDYQIVFYVDTKLNLRIKILEDLPKNNKYVQVGEHLYKKKPKKKTKYNSKKNKDIKKV